MKIPTIVTEYERVCTDIMEEFIDRYFVTKSYHRGEIDAWWVGSEIGGVCAISDTFLDVDSMVEYMKHRYSKSLFFKHYWYSLEERKNNRIPINIKNYKKLKK